MSGTQVPDEKLGQQALEYLPVSSRNANEKSSKSFTLEDLKSMFKSSVEEEIVEMIWQDSNEKSEIALSFLSEMCPTHPLSPPTPKPINTWSNIVADATNQPLSVQSARPKAKSIQQKQIKFEIADTIKKRVRKHERILIILRGVPGCGKSSLARKMQGNGVVLSTDDYFVNSYGEYYFEARSLPEAHSWNQRRADREMKASTNPIIIDNTNLDAWEMQPYISMALRYKYSIELVEPDTPWKNDARTLTQKNTHGVPRWKIEQMLEKQRVPVDLAIVIESCRQKMNLTSKPSQDPCSNLPGTSTDLVHCQEPQSPMVTTDSVKCIFSTSTAAVPSLTSSSSSTSKDMSNNEIPNGEAVIAAETAVIESSYDGKASQSEEIAVRSNMDATILQALRPDKKEPPVEESSTGDSESIGRGSKMIQSKRKALAVLKSYFPALDTKDLADILEQCKCDVTWAINVLLDSGYECADVVLDTADLLEEEFEETLKEGILQQAPTGTLSETATDLSPKEESEQLSQKSSSEASGSTEDTEALRRHIQECFQLTDTISERARRVCGKDYTQFRASQLSKLRHGQPASESNQLDFTAGPCFEYAIPPLEMVPSLEAPPSLEMGYNPIYSSYDLGATGSIDYQSYDETYQMPSCSNNQLLEAMIPITLDPTFIQQLVNVFGPPDSHAGKSEIVLHNRPVSFDIPWSLAEQLYYSWCSNTRNDESEEAPGENTEDYTEGSGGRQFDSVMDIEFAMKLVESERNAELRQLRDSLSTKLSRNMLEEKYPQVDPLALEALFEANSYNYAHTVAALNASLGTTPKANEPMEIKSPSKQKPKLKDATVEEGEETTGYNDIRSDAFMYNQLRQQFAAKARENHSRGMSAVAAYYASESRRYAALYKECNQKAALQIVEKKNARQDDRTIDLHELHVTEALSCLESFIASNQKDGRTIVHVITGRGNNSVNGRPRIKPAVVTFLNQKKYAFEEINPGMLRVFIKRTVR